MSKSRAERYIYRFDPVLSTQCRRWNKTYQQVTPSASSTHCQALVPPTPQYGTQHSAVCGITIYTYPVNCIVSSLHHQKDALCSNNELPIDTVRAMI